MMQADDSEAARVTCCIVGGGPAGMVLGFLLARAGVEVLITRLPLPLRMLQNFPVLRRIPARMVGVGVRPEHVHSPDAHV